MTTVLGKRKHVHIAKAIQRRSSEDTDQDAEIDVQAIFRQHFEARFQPLAARHDDTRRGGDKFSDPAEEDGEEDEEQLSDWAGFSSDSDAAKVEVFDYTGANGQDARNEPSKEELKAFMSSKPPSTPRPTKASSPSPSSSSDDDNEAQNLHNDLALQRLLRESHLLAPNTTTTTTTTSWSSATLAPTGAARHRALDLHAQALGARGSVLAQRRMPLAHRRGIAAAAAAREEKRRREAREAGVVLEAAGRRRGAGEEKERMRKRRERAVGGPAVGRFRGGTLRLSGRDVREIEGPRERRGRGKRRG